MYWYLVYGDFNWFIKMMIFVIFNKEEEMWVKKKEVLSYFIVQSIFRVYVFFYGVVVYDLVRLFWQFEKDQFGCYKIKNIRKMKEFIVLLDS